MTRPPLRRPLVTAAALAVVLALGACTPVVATIRPTLRIEGTVTLRAGVRLVHVPQDRPAGGIVVRPVDARSFTIPPGHYPPPGSCRAWVPGRPPGLQTPPGPCPVIERDLPPGAYLVVG
jgi:hypothetical protein